MKIITSTHYNRPKCTRQMLDHLVRCEGIEEYKVLFFVEPDTQFLHAKKGVTRDNRVITDIINSYDLNSEIIVNKRLLGIYKNKIKALLVGFHQSDYVIHIEDDILLAKDPLRFYEHSKKLPLYINSDLRFSHQ